MGYYWAVQKERTLTFCDSVDDLENSMLSEIVMEKWLRRSCGVAKWSLFTHADPEEAVSKFWAPSSDLRGFK